MPEFVPSHDAETRNFVRALTDYDDNADELPQLLLETQLKICKMGLHNKYDIDDFYADSGITQALVAGTAIKCKLAVENYSVSSWTVGDQSIDVSGVRDTDVPQLQSWQSMYQDGIATSDETASRVPQNTADYISRNNQS